MNPTTIQNINATHLVLMGAICGDIIGSAYEFNHTKEPDFRLFTPFSWFTDDTVCSIALADAINNEDDYGKRLQKWCRSYPDSRYGGRFRRWIASESPQPYNSWGNGSAMRVSAAGAFAGNLDEAMSLAKESAIVTHNHPEGIKGAQATAVAIYFALRGMSKEEIKSMIEKGFGYDLSRDYFDIQHTYKFDVSCQGSVPEAIIAFLQSTDYESAIRLAVALGGDADTQAAIAGGIAAAYYGEIPEHILSECTGILPDDMKEVIEQFNNKLVAKHGL